MIYFNGKEITPKLNGVNLSRVMYNGKQVWPKIVAEIALADTKAGDVLLWDKANQRKLFTSSDNLSNYPADSYTPIGVVVIPASHNVYGDGSCGVMSLKEMSSDTPDEGSTSYNSFYWGQNGIDLSLPNLDQVPIGNASDGIPTGQADRAYLPSDKFNDTQCTHDADTYYYSASNTPIPSPYLTSSSRNPGYYQTTSPSSTSNALADFDGIGNSQVLWDHATSQSNWKTASSITNNSESGYSPAACCCWRYHTEGTNQGDWYLPACGELGYVMLSFNSINTSITNILDAYGSSIGAALFGSDCYWSSSEYDSNYARNINMLNGFVGYGMRAEYEFCLVRAFLHVSPLDTQETNTVNLSVQNGTFEDGTTSKEVKVVTNSLYTLPTVVPNDSYEFSRWEEGGQSSSSSQNPEFSIFEDRTFVAICEPSSVTPTPP